MRLLRDKFVVALWALGFDYVTNTSSAQVYWRGSSAQHVIEVPKVEMLEYAWAVDSLRRCGVKASEIDRVLGPPSAD